MFHPTAYQGTLEENYETVLLQLKGLTYEESDLIANLSNASALLNQFLEDINWVGFYLNHFKDYLLASVFHFIKEFVVMQLQQSKQLSLKMFMNFLDILPVMVQPTLKLWFLF